MAAVSSATLSGDPRVDALIDGLKWSNPITFSFPTLASEYGDYLFNPKEYESGFGPAGAAYQTAARWVLIGSSFAAYSAFSNLAISEVTGGAGVIRLAKSSLPDTAYAYLPSSAAAGGDVWFGPYMDTKPDPQPGNYAWATVMHELGHSLGLKHGQENDGVSGQAVPAEWDSLEFTIMTYRSYIGDPLTGGYSNETWGFPQTPMMLDIAAIQQMYGADFTTNAGNTSYTFNPTTGAMSIDGAVVLTPGGNRVFVTIWDGGGTDTYDFSAYGGGVAIDLTPGGWSLLSTAQLAALGDSHTARANVFNALQYQGDVRSLIENAIGGAGQDFIVGNAAANRITGKGGGDTLTGGAGGDTFVFLAASDFTTSDDVTDFTGGGDRLDFSAISGLTFIGSNAFSNVSGQLNYSFSGGMTLVRYDGNGDGAADATVRLLGGSFTLTETSAGSKILQTGSVADTTAPTLSSTTPADNATGVAVGANLTLTFSEAVQAGTGSIEIRRTSDASLFSSIAVTDATQVSIAGSVLTLNPTANLAAGVGYYVVLASGVIRDLAANAYAGISSATAFNFTTAATIVDDYAATTATTGTVSVGASSTGAIETSGDIDWFRITLTAGHTYRLDMEGADTGQGTLVDPLLDLRNSAGQLIAQYDDGGTHWNAQGQYAVVNGGTFYLAAQSFSPASSVTGTYRLSVTDVTPDATAPTLLSSTPADNATAVAVASNIALTFSEAVQAGTGAVEIRKVSDGSLVRSISIGDGSQVSISGGVVTLNPASDLAAGTAYYVTLASGVIRDLAGNAYGGISGATALNFTTAVPADTTAPTLLSTSPADNAGSVEIDANLTLTFSEAIQAGTGAVEIRKASDGSLVRSIAIGDVTQASIAGATLTLNPASDLATSAGYYVVLASGVIRDLAGNAFGGISSATAFNFTTEAPADTAGPVLLSTSPADNSASVAADANLTLTFDEAVQAGAGTIEIHKVSDGSLVTAIAVTDASQVSIAGALLTINPSANLAGGVGYYITIAADTVRDVAGNAYAGIASATAFNFTTAQATPGPDTLVGGSGADTIDGLGGDDTLQGLGGNDQLIGSAGTDKALYAASSANYAWWSDGAGTWTVKDLRAGSPDGTDTLTGVEQLQFSDRTIKIVGASTNETLTYAFENVLRKSATGTDLGFLNGLINQVSLGQKTMAAAVGEIVTKADQTTAVAAMSYQFFLGFAPSKGGFDYLVSPTGPNPNNINSAYYQAFNIENRYINFAVNLGKAGEGAATFLAEYGSKTLFQATKDAYAEIFGGTPTDAKVNLILDSSVGSMTRAQYFASYGGDGLSGIGAKAAMVGWLLTEAAKADLGMMALSANAYFTDLADGAPFQVDLIGAYGQPGWAYSG